MNKIKINKLFSSTLKKYKPVLNMSTINPNLITAEYSVRGEVVIKSNELRQLQEKGEKLPFDTFMPLNIGNPQAVGQNPIEFPREVISCLYSNLDKTMYKGDIVARAETYRNELSNVEAYTHFKGMETIRKNIAQYIKERDNCEVDPEDLMLTNGASNGIKIVLQTLLDDRKDTILTPIPQYPLYSACIELLGGTLAGYYLNEKDNWGADIKGLEQVYNEHKSKGNSVKAVVVINPGNPTGNVLSRQNIEDIIKFTYDNNLVLLADEVYQNNIYSSTKEFHSFRKVASQMPEPYRNVILFSFHSVSKGYFGECGLRGGYTDMMNVPQEWKDIIFKLKALEVCPNLMGQITMDLLVKQPNEKDNEKNTVEKYNEEVDTIKNDLKDKAIMLTERLNQMKGFSSNEIEGAMYAFPNIKFPDHIKEKAKKQNKEVDLYYCLELLNKTGVIAVPGSGFGQEPGTYHIRLTNLVTPKSELMKTLDRIEEFNKKFFN